MKKTLQRLNAFVSTLVLSLSALAVYAPQAHAAAKTWDGGGADNNWNTAANWNGDSVPQNGDTLTFDVTSLSEHETLTNNISNLSIAGLTLTGSNSSSYSYTLSGNGLTLTGPLTGTEVSDQGQLRLSLGITLGDDLTVAELYNIWFESEGSLNLGSYSLTVDNADGGFTIQALSGSGDVFVQDGYLSINESDEESSYTGDIEVSAGSLYLGYDLGADASVTVSGTGRLSVYGILSTPVTLGGTGYGVSNNNSLAQSCGYTCTADAELTGNVTLTSDVKVWVGSKLTISGTLDKAGHSIELTDNSTGELVLPGGESVEPEKETVTIDADDKDPNTDVSVGKNKTYVIDGERGGVTLYDGGILKGTGKVAWINAASGSTLAPGHSPGTMTVLNSLSLSEGSEFEAEVLSKDSYDKFVVGEDFTGDNSVVLNNATLSLWIPEGFSIGQDDTFTIIDNQHDSEVDGTFKDLPEGATFKAGGESDGVFKISYVGGDGNDVVLSVITVPTVPSTGFALLLGNPAMILVSTLAAAGAAYYLVRRSSLASKSARR